MFFFSKTNKTTMETTSSQTQCLVFKTPASHWWAKTYSALSFDRINVFNWRVCILILLSMESVCNVLLFASNNRFIIQLQEYQRGLSINVHSCLLITRIRDRLTWVQFSRAFRNAVADWSEMKTCQTGLLSESFFFFKFRWCKDGVTNNYEAYDVRSSI